MRIVATGASGLIGTAVAREAIAQGHEFVALIRGSDSPHSWSVETGISPAHLEAADVVLHLGGESIGEGRWTASKLQRIFDSRVNTTKAVASSVARSKVRTLLVASAIGIYGDRGNEWLDEDSQPGGSGQLPRIGVAWERASAMPESDVRVVNLRFGVVLSVRGGMLAKLRPLFRLGLGAAIGLGRQWLSWISEADAARAILFAAENERIVGPTNIVSPNPVTNLEFSLAFARSLRRPMFLRIPSMAIRLMLGTERANELLLASQRVLPAKLTREGFQFGSSSLESALAAMQES